MENQKPEVEIKDPTKKKKIGKIILYTFYFALTVGILIFVLTQLVPDLKNVGEYLATANGWYILAAVGLTFVYLGLYPLTIVILNKKKKTGCSGKATYCIGMTEHFFNGITPFATGGQPFQVYSFARKKVKPSTSTGLLLMNFFNFMLVTNTFALISLVYYQQFATTTTAMTVISIVGFSINFTVLACTILLATSKKVAKAIVWMMRICGKIKPLHNIIEKNVENFQGYVDSSQAAFKELIKSWKTFIAIYVVRFVAMAAYYMVTFYVLKALNLNVGYDQLFFVICGSSFACTMVVFVPTPGATGGIEFAFTNIFMAFVPGMTQALAASGMLIWRLMTFYLPIFISFCFFIGLEIQTSKQKKKEAALAVETPAEEEKVE